ncbi:metal ABC transporter permease [Deferribacter thermophilus]|uniref:metal ABC transporter permease n=1 Tax=Deferribacter thermophilus TaxID=53573 RepID=UPI003C2363AD
MSDIFGIEIVKYAFLNGVIISILCGFLSFFVVQKRMSFLTVTISHSAFGAIGLALLLNINQQLALYVLSFLIAVIVFELKKRSKIEFETILGIFFAITMAIGVISLKFARNSSFDLSGILFGSILSSNRWDLFISIIISLIVFAMYFIFFDKIIFTIFDEEVAEVSGVKTNLMNYIILISLTLVVVICIKITGIILLTAFLTLPSAITLLFTKSYRITIILSIILSLIIFISSFFVAYSFDLPPGTVTVLVGGIIYLISSFLVKKA